MIALPRSGATGPTNPRIVFYAQARGMLADPYALSFQIFDVSDDTKKLTPVQVFPTISGNKQAVDLVTEKLGTGRFAPTWAVDVAAAVGEYEVRWFYKMASTDAETQASQALEVVTAGSPRGPYYCLLADIRAEGLTSTKLNDASAMLAIVRASAFIEKVTGRYFEPRYVADFRVDGKGRPGLNFDMPIIGIESLEFETSPLFPSSLAIEADMFRVYNRHLRGVFTPDDREAPRLEMFTASDDLAGAFSFTRLVFPRGQQNVYIKGVFGYTEPDGTPFGQVPGLLRRAAQLLVFWDYEKLVNAAARDEAMKRGRILSETTRDQSYSLEPNHLKGAFTGNPEIDQLLVSFCRPPRMGAA